jgi:hypothetical protein
MNALKLTFCAGVAGLSLSACASHRISTAERDAAVTAAATSSASAAIIARDGTVGDGSAVAVEGYYTGCRAQAGCFVGGKRVSGRDALAFDNQLGRYYFIDPETRKTYWENGQLRG